MTLRGTNIRELGPCVGVRVGVGHGGRAAARALDRVLHRGAVAAVTGVVRYKTRSTFSQHSRAYVRCVHTYNSITQARMKMVINDSAAVDIHFKTNKQVELRDCNLNGRPIAALSASGGKRSISHDSLYDEMKTLCAEIARSSR